jgi:hypothetical protein
LGHQVTVLLPNAPSKSLQLSVGYTASFVRIAEDSVNQVEELFQKAEIHFALDYNSPSRVGAALEPLVRAFAGRQVLIDHHQQPDPLFVEA